ncbi:LOW QUALITY PROTEIN: mitochondrial enolase superfamily member 1 [Ara ararauna]
MPNNLYAAWISDIFTDVLTDEEAYDGLDLVLLFQVHDMDSDDFASISLSDTSILLLHNAALQENSNVYNPVDGFQFTVALIIQKRSISCSKCASRFKVKVGEDLDDICKCRFIQEMIGLDKIMMLDANQQWEIKEAKEWVTKPADFKPRWIKEPSFPEGHATISKLRAALVRCSFGRLQVLTFFFFPLHCHNRVIFNQLLHTKALSSLQMDSCKLGCMNENLPVLLIVQSKALQNTAAMRKSFSLHSPSQSD